MSEALTPDVVRNGIREARPYSDYAELEKAGRARQQADWLIGINGTRFLTCSTKKLLTFGRVQTAILGAVYQRDSVINNFKREKYFQLKVMMDKGGSLFPMLLLDEDGSNRFSLNSSFFERAISKVIPSSRARIYSVETERKTENPPSLFNITGLQKICSSKFGYKPKDTLDIVQSLYEKLKCVSYPRTASQRLGDDNVDLYLEKFGELSKIYPDYAKGCQKDKIIASNKSVFNSTLVEGHHALMPLGPLPETADDRQRNVYLTVLKRFFDVMKKPYVYDSIEVIAIFENYRLKGTGRTVIQQGWKDGQQEEHDIDSEDFASSIPGLCKGDILSVVSTEKLERETKPPRHYTNSTLLAMMENPKNPDAPSVKLAGLGTPATRAGIIDELNKRGYLETKGKNITVSDSGKFLVESVMKVPELSDFISIETTTKWEQMLSDNPNEFLAEMRAFVVDKIPRLQLDNKWESPQKESVGSCPSCKLDIIEGKKCFFCSGYKNGCEFKIWKSICGANITKKDAEKLLEGGATRPKKMKSKAGKDFTAGLIIKNMRIEFVFDSSPSKNKRPD